MTLEPVWLDCIEFARPLPAGWQRLDEAEGGVSAVWRGQVTIGIGPDIPVFMKDIPAAELAKELIGTAIAMATAVPVPRAFLVFSDAEEFAAQHAPTWSGTTDKLLFASVQDVERNWRHVQHGGNAVKTRLCEWSHLPALVAFDEWLANGDRHDRNLMYGGDDEFLPIDHARILGGPGWPGRPLGPRELFPHRLIEEVLKPVPTDCRYRIARGASDYIARANNVDLDALLLREPLQSLLTSSDLKAALQYLKSKRTMLGEKVLNLVGMPVLI
ncbi:hypothetical protein [Falsiroseomonas sp.]|uniref:hypothetical protein n=1 Tax=Falsiroseomonas sp. TaxID=2870721 RepID=UPI003F70B898